MRSIHRTQSGRALLRVAAAATCALIASAFFPSTGSADPIISNRDLIAKAYAPDGSQIVSGAIVDSRHLRVVVHSTAMNADIPVEIQRPADTSAPRPVLYLLNGAGGGEDAATWTKQTNVLPWLSSTNVNVVMPIGGEFSYYADWVKPDPKLGVNKWNTFLTKELPPLINAGLGTNGVNAIAGLSMSGTSVLSLAQSAPQLYRAVAAYSGCAQIADPVGREFVNMVVSRGGGNLENMYGPDNDPRWAENDPVLHADKLRGIRLFISAGTGIPGVHETLNDPHLMSPGPIGLANQAVVGGAIEAATDYCSHNLVNRLNDLRIPVVADFRPTGTHSWGYWEQEFKISWPLLRNALDVTGPDGVPGLPAPVAATPAISSSASGVTGSASGSVGSS